MPITYQPNFQHAEWVDNQDRVMAGGSNGFNIRFNGIEAEFQSVSQIVTQISTALDTLGQRPTPQAVKLTLTPNLVSTAVNGWSHATGIAQKPGGQTSAAGMMTINLPGVVRIVSLRAIGRNSGTGSLRVQLSRQGITADSQTTERVVRVEGTGDPFDATAPADAAFATLDPDRHKCFLVAQVDNAAAADTVLLTAFQLTYVPVQA